MSSSLPSSARSRIKLLTYNVWSREHVAVYARIRAICDIIERHDPDVIFLQEVTTYIHSIFKKAPWWGQYKTTKAPNMHIADAWPHEHPAADTGNHFWLTLIRSQQVVEGMHDAPPGLFTAAVSFPEAEGDTAGFHSGVQVSTFRLVSPTPADVRSMERGDKARFFFLDTLDRCWYRNSVFGGDMNWDDDLDGPFPIEERDGWVDAWTEVGDAGGGGGGWTYDTVANPMLRGLGKKPEWKRPDRFICKLTDYDLDGIQMVGTDVIPGVTYHNDQGDVVPVLPSHRFGLLLTIKPKDVIRAFNAWLLLNRGAAEPEQ